MGEEPEPLEEDEVEEQEAEELPDREVMTIIDPGGASTGNLSPPALDPSSE